MQLNNAIAIKKRVTKWNWIRQSVTLPFFCGFYVLSACSNLLLYQKSKIKTIFVGL